jgi:hypothetical protein
MAPSATTTRLARADLRVSPLSLFAVSVTGALIVFSVRIWIVRECMHDLKTPDEAAEIPPAVSGARRGLRLMLLAASPAT